MRKSLLSLGVAALTAGTLHVQAATIEAAEGQVWWGYYSGSDARTGYGSGSAELFNQAIHIEGNDLFAGKTIKAVRLYLPANTDAATGKTTWNAPKLWLSKEQPVSAAKADVLTQSLTLSQLSLGNADDSHYGLPNDIELTTPYTIGAEGIYVGYSLTALNKVATPIAVGDAEAAHADGFWLKTSQTHPGWGDISATAGNLAIQLLLEGDFLKNAAAPADFSTVRTKLGADVEVQLTLRQTGINAISSYSYTVEANGQTSDEQTVELAKPVNGYGDNFTISVPLQPATEVGLVTHVITITKVNGQPNEAGDISAQGTVNTVDRILQKHVVVEEYTGTGCGWCPRGLVGMQKLHKALGEQFVGIGLHQYNPSDPMYIAPNLYRTVSFQGAPSCRLNRGSEIDPYYGSNTDIVKDAQAALQGEIAIGVSVGGQWIDDGNAVEATAAVFTQGDFPAGYVVELVLIGDSLTSPEAVWRQSNYYYQYQQSQLPPDLQQFGAGGTNGGTTISGWIFDDVALASSCKGNNNQIDPLPALPAGSSVSVSHTLALPTKATLRPAVDAAAADGKIAVVALLVAPGGAIVNADKLYLPSPVAAGISQPATRHQSGNAGAKIYDLQGRAISQPAHGLYIKDGRKYVVR